MSDELKRYNLDEARKAVKILFSDVKFGNGECIEVRMPNKKKNLTAAGWFDDLELLAKAVCRLARDGHGQLGSYRHSHENVFWTCNPVNDALLARQTKNTIEFVAETTSDSHITRRVWLPVDIDPIRPSGVSATADEKRLAREVANALMVKLQEFGFPESCLVGGSSGNGYHILIRRDLPNDDASRDLTKQCLAAMQAMVGTGKVEIDPKVFNAARIIKCYGTMACKGMNDDNRKWRMASLTIVPEMIEPVSRELLESLAATAPTANSKRAINAPSRGPWTEDNTSGYIKLVGWHCKEPKPIDGGKLMWEGDCIENDQHFGGARLILHADGWVSYGCRHTSCTAKHQEFFAHWDEEHGEAVPRPGLRRPLDRLDDLGPIDFDDGSAGETIEQAKTPKSFHLTDAGNMERLVYRFGHLFRYCPQRGWYGWSGKHWQADDVQRIFRAALNTVRSITAELPLHLEGVKDEDDIKAVTKAVHGWAKESESRGHLTAMEFLARSARGAAVSIHEFDRDKWLFNASNGTLNLRSGDFKPQDQSDMITQLSPVAYEPKAECPLWKAFLSDVMAGDQELVDYLQRAVGYSLTGSTEEHCLFMNYGTGRNGKTTFLEAVKHVLGTYAQAAPMTAFLDTGNDNGVRNDIARLVGARFVTAVEADAGKRLAESLVKQLTGGDTIAARFLFKEYFDFKPQFKLWMGTNHKPVIHGTDEGIWRRIRLIPWTVYIPDGKKDETLPEKLRAEAPGILRWAIEGLEEYHKHGLMDPEIVTKATEEYRGAEDMISRFLEECCEVSAAHDAPARKLYERYKEWAEDMKEYVLKERKFAEGMQEHDRKSKQKSVGGKMNRVYEGLRIRDRFEGIGDRMVEEMPEDVF